MDKPSEFSSISAIQIETDIDLQSLKKYVKETVISISQSADLTGEFPFKVYQQLHKLGWMQAFVPKEYGGKGVSTLDLACIAREIAYGSAGIYTTILANMLGMVPVLLHGEESLRKNLCESLLKRFQLWSFCMTEPETGSDVGRLQTKASIVDGGYMLNGRKCFITNSAHASHFTVFAAIDDASAKRPQITAFYVPADSPGVRRGASLNKLGHRDSNTGDLFFDSVFVPTVHRLGQVGQGLEIGFHSLQRSRILIGAAGVGMCNRANDLLAADLSVRPRYGKVLLANPTIQTFLGALNTEVHASWLLVAHAAAIWDSGAQRLCESSMAKWFSAHTAVKFTSEALELFGGNGYCRGFEFEKLYRDSKLLEIYEGSSFIQQILIARELFPLSMRRTEKLKRVA